MGEKGDLLDREREQAALTDLIEGARAGRGGALVLEGPPGIGRSSLLNWTAERAREHGVRTSSIIASPVSRQIPFGIVRRLLGPLVAERPDLVEAGWARRARPLFDPDFPGSTTTEPLVEGLLALVQAAVTAYGSLLMLVDDAQWVDPGSAVLLAELALRAQEVGAGLVTAINTAEVSSDEPGPARLRSVAGVRVLELGPLRRDSVAALVADTRPGGHGGLADRVMAAAAGNPLLTRAFLAGRADPADPADTAAFAPKIPATVASWATERLERLPDSDGRLARAVAILIEAPLRIAARLAELDDAAADASADRLVGRGILCPGEPLRFQQPVIGEALLHEVPPFALGRLHHRAAQLLHADGVADTHVAIHLEHSRPSGDPWVSDVLARAARAFLTRGDPARAAEVFRRALAEPPAPAERDALLLEYAQAQAAAGLPTAIEAFREALERVADPASRAQAWHGLSRLLYARGEGRLAVAAAQEGRRETVAGSAADQRLLADELSAASLVPELVRDAAARTAQLIDGPDPTDPALIAHVIADRGWRGIAVERLPELARAAVADDPLVDPLSGGFALVFVAGGLNFIDATPLAIELLDAGLERVVARGDPLAEVNLRSTRAWSAYYMGDLAGAEEHVAAASGLSALTWPAVTGLMGPVAFMVALARGRTEDARATLAATPRTPQNLGFDYYEGLLALATGDPATALTHLEAAGAELEGVLGMGNPGGLPWRSGAALAAAAVGRPGYARELLAPELARARELGIPRSIGIALRVAGQIDDDVERLAESVAVLEGSAARLELARSLVALGAAYRSNRRLRDARTTLTRALELIDACGAHALAARAAAELRAAGARPRNRPRIGVAALSASERRVAELAAAGQTTREIAAELYLTPKTVEGHLTRIFRKLLIDSRGEIAARLAGEGPDIRPDDEPAASPSP